MIPLLVGLAAATIAALARAVVNERRMQRHRQPGVSYWDVTLRRDGAWRRKDLFTDEGLAYQSQAAKWGMIGTVLLIMTVGAWYLSSP